MMQQKRQKTTRRDELRECFYCNSKIKWPLEICSTGHFACALCLRSQILKGCLVTTSWNQNEVSAQFNWNEDFKCGICSEPAKVRYPGPIVTQLMENTTDHVCPTCKQVFSEATIAMHVYKCDHVHIKCPYCKNALKIVNNLAHVKDHCQAVPCRVKGCKYISNAKDVAKHVQLHLACMKFTREIVSKAQELQEELQKLHPTDPEQCATRIEAFLGDFLVEE